MSEIFPARSHDGAVLVHSQAVCLVQDGRQASHPPDRRAHKPVSLRGTRYKPAHLDRPQPACRSY
ncbi:MAG: hypothetical protein MZV64_19705 [Ignavibacteriales bacterium]|nr:hypothetical protein [Ignavibacteriales bacterium]